jgi:hypothetical protein
MTDTYEMRVIEFNSGFYTGDSPKTGALDKQFSLTGHFAVQYVVNGTVIAAYGAEPKQGDSTNPLSVPAGVQKGVDSENGI